jgi:RNA polymerase sigma-70 factor (ECF subfamily)
VITFPPEATELVKEARDQRGDALDRLLELVWPHAYRIAYAVVRDRGAAEDAAQEACAIVYCKIGGLRNLDSFRVWFYRIVVREAQRSAKKFHEPKSTFERAPTSSDESRLDTRRALESLSPPLRAVIILHYYAELTSKEIATILNIAAPTVRFRLMLARRRLKPLLEEHRDYEPVVQGNECQ